MTMTTKLIQITSDEAMTDSDWEWLADVLREDLATEHDGQFADMTLTIVEEE